MDSMVLFAPGTQWSQNATFSLPAAREVRMYGNIAAADAAAVVWINRRRSNFFVIAISSCC
jgi:hypothetical protein